jgi:hypothetical protein
MPSMVAKLPTKHPLWKIAEHLVVKILQEFGWTM